MPRLVSISASDRTLWKIALRYLGDPLQAGRIAALNGISDFWLFDLPVPTELIIPDADATLSGYAPTDPGTDFLVLMGLVLPGVGVGGYGSGGTSSETLVIISVRAVSAGAPFTVSLGYSGPLTGIDYRLNNGPWLEASGVLIQNGGAIFSVPGMPIGNHTLMARDSVNNEVQSKPFGFRITSASGSPIPDTVAYDPNNDYGGDLEDMVVYAPATAPLGQFVLGANCLAPDPPLQVFPGVVSSDFEAFGISP